MRPSEAFMIRTAVFESGERLPVLLHRDTYQPVILCTRYILDERREIRQAATLLRDVRVLRWLYEWFEMAARDLEGDLRRGRLPTLSELTGFCHYLREKRIDRSFVPSTVVARPQPSVLGPQTFNSYLGVVQDFLMWAADEFRPSAIPFQEVEVSLDAAKERILRAFRINRTTGRLPKKRYGLSDEEVKELRDAVNPGSLRNPFRPGVRFRNCIITDLCWRPEFGEENF